MTRFLSEAEYDSRSKFIARSVEWMPTRKLPWWRLVFMAVGVALWLTIGLAVWVVTP